MSIRLRAPLRGLLTGLFVLIAFAFTAVSMTAGGSRVVIGGLPRPLTARAVVPTAGPTAAASATQTAASRVATASAGDEAHRRGDGGHHR